LVQVVAKVGYPRQRWGVEVHLLFSILISLSVEAFYVLVNKFHLRQSN